jgi:hypothetical protein
MCQCDNEITNGGESLCPLWFPTNQTTTEITEQSQHRDHKAFAPEFTPASIRGGANLIAPLPATLYLSPPLKFPLWHVYSLNNYKPSEKRKAEAAQQPVKKSPKLYLTITRQGQTACAFPCILRSEDRCSSNAASSPSSASSAAFRPTAALAPPKRRMIDSNLSTRSG